MQKNKMKKQKSCFLYRVFFTLVLGACALLLTVNSYAQTAEPIEGLGPLLSEAATQYLQPVFPALSANFNSGWFSSIPPRKKLAFDIEIGLAAVGTRIGSGAEDFSIPGHYYFSPTMAQEFTESIADQPNIRSQVVDQLVNTGIAMSMSGGTIIGGNQNVTLHFGDKDEINFVIRHPDYPFPVYVNLEAEPFEVEAGGVLGGWPALPLAFPQIKLGTIMGTQLIFRGVPPIAINDDVGDFSFTGFGLMHNPMVWLPKILPVQAALGGMWQSISLGDHLDIRTLSFAGMVGYQLGKRWVRLTPQLGFISDRTTMEFNYTESIDVPGGEEEITLDMSLEQAQSRRTFVGLHLYLVHLNFFARYFMSGETGVAGGISISF